MFPSKRWSKVEGPHPHQPREGWWRSITNCRLAAELWVCCCVRSSTLSSVPFFLLEKPQVADIAYFPGDKHSCQGRWRWRGGGLKVVVT